MNVNIPGANLVNVTPDTKLVLAKDLLSMKIEDELLSKFSFTA